MSFIAKCTTVILLSVIILFLAAIYFFIPRNINIQVDENLNCNSAAASRMISHNWKKIFSNYPDSAFIIDHYKIRKVIYNGAQININQKEASYESSIALIQMSRDTSLLHWNTTINTTNNPINRVTAYFKAKDLEEDINRVAKHIKAVLDKPENIYGYHIGHTTLSDTVLIFTSHFSQAYPTTNDIYQLIGKIKTYIKENGALETNSPMLNVSKFNNGFMIKIGIPTNKELPANKELALEPRYMMPMKDKILTTDVHGGEASVKDAYQQIEQFMQDYSMSPPVIPYELLITDRSKEPDTTKWITRIYYPII